MRKKNSRILPYYISFTPPRKKKMECVRCHGELDHRTAMTCAHKCGTQVYCGQKCADADYEFHIKNNECIGAVLPYKTVDEFRDAVLDDPRNALSLYREYAS